MKKRFFALVLAFTMALSLIPAQAAAESDWLIPKTRDYAAFTDTKGTIAETAAKICCEVGLMDGIDQRYFMPSIGLSNAQVIVICARLHKLLTGGSLDYFVPISLKGLDWWTPYDNYLKENIEGWPFDFEARSEYSTDDPFHTYPVSSCSRGFFLTMLSAVLKDANVELPERNAVPAVPDCNDPEILQFYRWGILGGKDTYGTLQQFSGLSRGAAAAMLARIVDPSQRLTFTLKTFDLCRDIFFWERETVVLTVDGTDITAEQFAPALANEMYNDLHDMMSHIDHGASDYLNGAERTTIKRIAIDRLAEKNHVVWNRTDLEYGGDYGDGYRGRSANGQLWLESHYYLEIVSLRELYQKTYGEEGYYKLNEDIDTLTDQLSAVRSPILTSLDEIGAAYYRLLQYPTYRFEDW